MSGISEPWKRMEKHLGGVSRSFAFCIAVLDDKLREDVSLAYLLFRFLDSIEDTPFETAKSQQQAFGSFVDCLKFHRAERDIDDFLEILPLSRMPPAESKLCSDAPFLFERYHQLEPELREIFHRYLVTMAEGMCFFKEKSSWKNELKIQSLEELNLYCFFVAGIVGELLTDLYTLRILKRAQSGLEKQQAVEFGLFLQKVNVLKDQQKDIEEGRVLVSDRALVLESLAHHQEAAFRYITQIPEQESGFKLFCAWSFFLGLASMPSINESWERKSNKKISRVEAWVLLEKVRSDISDNHLLEEIYRSKKLEKTEPRFQSSKFSTPPSLSVYEIGMQI